MSFFEQMAGKTAPQPEEAEVKLDLSGMEKPDALQKLDAVVKYCKKSSAASLYVSVKTIETYKMRAMDKLDLHSRVDVVKYAARQGWLPG